MVPTATKHKPTSVLKMYLQIRKSLKKKHTVPHYKLRYKPFFNKVEDTISAESVSMTNIQITLHRISRLNELLIMNNVQKDVYCVVGVGERFHFSFKSNIFSYVVLPLVVVHGNHLLLLFMNGCHGLPPVLVITGSTTLAMDYHR